MKVVYSYIWCKNIQTIIYIFNCSLEHTTKTHEKNLKFVPKKHLFLEEFWKNCLQKIVKHVFMLENNFQALKFHTQMP